MDTVKEAALKIHNNPSSCQYYPSELWDEILDYLVNVLNYGVVEFGTWFGLFPGQGLNFDKELHR